MHYYFDSSYTSFYFDFYNFLQCYAGIVSISGIYRLKVSAHQNNEIRRKKERKGKKGKKKVKKLEVVGSKSQTNSFPTFQKQFAHFQQFAHYLGHDQKHSLMNLWL